MRMWSVKTGHELKKFLGHSVPVFPVGWSIDGLLASGSYDHTVKIWNPSAGECLKTLEGHSAQINNVRWWFDGTMLASCSGGVCQNDNSVRLWNVGTGEQLKKLEGHSELSDWSG